MSDQARAIWSKLKQWYGHPYAEKHGDQPSREWVELLNSMDRETAINALASIKTAHPKFVPTFMEVQEAIRKASRPVDTVDVRIVLSEYILREYQNIGITLRQLGFPWKWIANLQSGLDTNGMMRDNQICNYVGVLVPADPHLDDSRAVQVMFAEIDPRMILSLLAKHKSRYTPKAAA